MFLITVDLSVITQRKILQSLLSNEFSTPRLTANLRGQHVPKVALCIKRTRPSDGKRRKKICKKCESGLQWHPLFGSLLSAQVVPRHQCSPIAMRLHHRLRLITTTLPLSSNQRSPTKLTSNTHTPAKSPAPVTTQTSPNTKTAGFPSPTLPTPQHLPKRQSLASPPSPPNPPPSTSMARTSTSMTSPPKAKTNILTTTPAQSPSPAICPTGPIPLSYVNCS